MSRLFLRQWEHDLGRYQWPVGRVETGSNVYGCCRAVAGWRMVVSGRTSRMSESRSARNWLVDHHFRTGKWVSERPLPCGEATLLCAVCRGFSSVSRAPSGDGRQEAANGREI